MFRLIIAFTAACIFSSTPLALGKAITVTDQAGRKVVVQQPVQKVVTTFIPATMFALTAGLNTKLVGASSKDGTSSIYEALINKSNPPVLVGNRSVGLNLETISSLKPDLIIMYGQKDGVRTADRLTRLGFPTVVIVPETLDAMKEALDLIGRAAGNKAHTDKVIEAMSRIEREVQERVAGRGTPGVYYATSNLLRTVSGNMMQDKMITIAGGKNVSGETSGFFVNISREQLFAWNPDIIICSDRLAPAEIERIKAPEFAHITANQNHHIYKVPDDTYWDFPSPLAMAGVLWMSNKIHPDAYKPGEARSTIDQFYDTIFGKGFSASHPTVVGRRE